MMEPSLRERGAVMVTAGGVRSPFTIARYSLCTRRFFCHIGHNAGADQVFGNYGKSGGIPVQAVAATEDKRLYHARALAREL